MLTDVHALVPQRPHQRLLVLERGGSQLNAVGVGPRHRALKVEIGDVIRALHDLDRRSPEIDTGKVGIVLDGLVRTRESDALLDNVPVRQRAGTGVEGSL